MNDRLEGLGPGPRSTHLSRVEQLEDAIRDLRATKTPATWTDAERRLFGLLPEARKDDRPAPEVPQVRASPKALAEAQGELGDLP